MASKWSRLLGSLRQLETKMQTVSPAKAGFLTIAVAAALWAHPFGQDAPTQETANKSAQRIEAPADEAKGLPPRAAPTDYQAIAKAGPLTIGAEFAGHSVPTADGAYNTDDYVVVEVGVFGAPDARARLSHAEFTLRINGKKDGQPTVPYEMVRSSLTDPSWSPPKEENKSKTTLGGAGGTAVDNTQAPVHMPMDLRLTMEQHVRTAVMLQGDRPLPQAGLLFFEFHGKTKKIRSLELIYSGPGGPATLDLQP